MVYAVIDTNIIDSSRFPYDGEMPDEDDRVFYEVCLSKEDSFLVTGNLKHFPKEPQVRDRWGKSTPNQVYVGNPP